MKKIKTLKDFEKRTCSCCGKEIKKKIFFPSKKKCDYINCNKEFLIFDEYISICPYHYAKNHLNYRERLIKGRGFDYWFCPNRTKLKKFLRIYPNAVKIIQLVELEFLQKGFRIFRYGIDYYYGGF